MTRAHRDERRAVVRPRGLEGRVDGLDVVAVRHALGVPAVGLEARQDVLRPGHARGSVELDVVVVVEDHEAAQAQVPGQAGGLARDALLEVAVGADDVGAMVDDVVPWTVELGGQASLGDGHAHGVGEALAQRSGGGLDAGGEAVLGVPGRARAELAEALQLVERQVVAGQVEQRVEEHAGVPGGEDEAVAVEPVRPRRGVAEEPRPQHVGHGRRAHGRAGVAAVGLLDAVDGEGADGVDGQLLVDGRCRGGQGLLLGLARCRQQPDRARHGSQRACCLAGLGWTGDGAMIPAACRGSVARTWRANRPRDAARPSWSQAGPPSCPA